MDDRKHQFQTHSKVTRQVFTWLMKSFTSERNDLGTVRNAALNGENFFELILLQF